MGFIPFYVGKGCDQRWCSMDRNETYRKVKHKMLAVGKEPAAIKLITDVDEKTALMIESKLIDIFGLVSYGGFLVNLDEGVNKDERRSCYRESFDGLRSLNRML